MLFRRIRSDGLGSMMNLWIIISSPELGKSSNQFRYRRFLP